MIALLDTPQPLSECEAELGCSVGQLLTPTTRRLLREPARPWAADNGAFANFEATRFLSLLERNEPHRASNLFVTVPDVVGSARRTLELFEIWKHKLPGWKLAFACQDGQEDLPIPWADIDAVFIGGSTKFKCGPHALHIVRAARALGKWVHIGRLNHAARFKHFDGQADSFDGSGLARYSHMRLAIAARHDQGELLT